MQVEDKDQFHIQSLRSINVSIISNIERKRQTYLMDSCRPFHLFKVSKVRMEKRELYIAHSPLPVPMSRIDCKAVVSF